MHGSSLVKEFGALLSTIFAIYGIGAQTRKENGHLNRDGWIALIGFVAAMLVTVTAQFLDDRDHAREAQAETERYEKLLSSASYGALSTQGAKVDLSFSVSIEDLKAVDPAYAKRIETIYRDPNQKGCSFERVSDDPGMRYSARYTCPDYVYEDTTLGEPEMRFDQSSTLVPNDSEPFAQQLINHLGIYFDVPSPDDRWKFFYEDPPLFKVDWSCRQKGEKIVSQDNGKDGKGQQPGSGAPKGCGKEAKFVFEGDVLRVRVVQRDWDPVAMQNANLTSVIDLLGHEIVLSPNDAGGCPDGNAAQCKELHRVLRTSKKLDRFALMFPHRRDIIFNGVTTTGDEKKGFILVIDPKNQAPVYKHIMPANVEDLPVTDRRDPDHR